MKIIYNNIIPFRGFVAVNLFCILFVRNNVILTDEIINHESIHKRQIRELLYVFFYLFYFIEWVLKLFKYGLNSYRNISFEREAYTNDGDLMYLGKRKRFAFLKYL